METGVEAAARGGQEAMLPGPGDRMVGRSWLPPAAVFVVAAALFIPTVRHGFTFDDGYVIVRNRYLRSLADLAQLFANTEWAGAGQEYRAYRPLTDVTYAFNHALTGLAPWSYHLANALLHGLAAALVLLLGHRWRLSARASLAGALFFAVHPVHVEAVSNVIGRKEVLAAIFCLAMVLGHAWSRRGSPTRIMLPLAAYAAAMLSKESGAVGIGLVALHDLLVPEQDSSRGRARPVLLYGAYALALAAYLVVFRTVTSGASGAVPFIDNPAGAAALPVRLMTAVAVIGKGLLLQLWPVRLSPDYSYAVIPLVRSALDPRFLGSAAVLGAWLAAAFRFRRTVPLLGLSAGWYLGALFPASNLAVPIGTIFGERLLYVPSVGLALLAGAALDVALTRLSNRWRPAWTAAAAVVPLALAALTLRYSEAWKDDLSLFSLAARNAPASIRAHYNLGSALLRAGRPAEALAEGRTAIAIHDGAGEGLREGWLHLLTAGAARALGDADAEREEIAAALAQDPTLPDALYARGVLEWRAGAPAAAERDWRAALARDPSHADSLSGLGTIVEVVHGDRAAAEELFLRSVDANPGQADAWYKLGRLRRERGDRPGARDAFERFLLVAGPQQAPQVEKVKRAFESGAL